MPHRNRRIPLAAQAGTVAEQLAAFGAGPPKPPAPPVLPITTVIADATRADRQRYGRTDAARVIAVVVEQLNRVQLMEIILDPQFSDAWRAAATRRLHALRGAP